MSNHPIINKLRMGEAKKGFFYSNGLIVSICLSFIGCFIGMGLLYRGTPFQEVKWQPRKIYDRILSAENDDSLHTLAKRLENNKMRSDSQFIASYWKDKFRLNTDSLNIDSIGESKVSEISKEILAGSINELSISGADTLHKMIPAVYVEGYDSSLGRTTIFSRKMLLDIKPYGAAAFFSKYPSFGMWALLIIIQLGFLLFILPFAVSQLFSSSTDSGFVLFSKQEIWRHIIYTVLIFGMFWIFIWFVFSGTGPAKSVLFLPGIKTVFGIVNITAYLIASMLFAVTLASVNKARRLVDSKETRTTALVAKANEIENAVNLIFILAAIMLSLAVLATGNLFSGLSSLDFVKQVSRDKGYNLFGNDTVYLYGLFHTFILLLFFIPVKNRIAAIKTALTPPALNIPGEEPVAATNPVPGIFTGSMKKIPELLLAGSPLLASLLQSLFDLLAN